MARIRSIKPELWSSPGMRGLDPWARLLFIAMWNWADDSGRGTANPRELAGFAFPHDEEISSVDVRRMLGELRRAFGVVFYEVGGRPYYWIPSWEKHQKIDKRSGAKYPAPEDGEPWDPNPGKSTHKPSDQPEQPQSEKPAETSAEPPESSAEPAGSSALEVGTGEQGNRGTGEKTPVTAVGGLTVRTARANATAPSAQPITSLAARSLIASIPRYRDAPGWARKRHLIPMAQAALDTGFGPSAITRYAHLVADEGRFLERQHIPEFREVLRRLSRDATLEGLCHGCGQQTCACPTPTVDDRPWTSADQADLEATLDHFGLTPDDLPTEGAHA
ncbi:hypothetical protein [Sphaerimonospora thailandensis]|uniref:Uncharacterized protein n=1 Tax=Sphaerimonospora thailandensis TaxID=795644 RepID=A0A8J3RAD8_9ACTN|nr:hypothetical protein [Sphaerimonospora thailandensis]GIH70302.1 hypothetical protein Mth01_25550 [Sphaerimonospora thailandensis]